MTETGTRREFPRLLAGTGAEPLYGVLRQDAEGRPDSVMIAFGSAADADAWAREQQPGGECLVVPVHFSAHRADEAMAYPGPPPTWRRRDSAGVELVVREGGVFLRAGAGELPLTWAQWAAFHGAVQAGRYAGTITTL
ncbi:MULTISPECIES: hypothetical protein [Protofrankia]|uniref:SseB protein N-terminal domain-containing protein n=1 Tax=Protofrankia coriariae TaxID=1562887 RepID=A0ABR5F493_9ACTN|nr:MULTISPECIES: hypothetical protein [Protofrankia]KLL11545.1 hypothetical protein FrCorBMG51_10915 [Protofrankia coriariae]ONH35678.1 hypothetical protein BL254_10315 [Protofrankia sp. BMG5.30]